MSCTVVNARHDEFDILITRGTIYGNPFVLGRHGNRPTVIKAFKKYAMQRVIRDDKFRHAILKCDGKRIGCVCKPDACHGDVFNELVELAKSITMIRNAPVRYETIVNERQP